MELEEAERYVDNLKNIIKKFGDVHRVETIEITEKKRPGRPPKIQKEDTSVSELVKKERKPRADKGKKRGRPAKVNKVEEPLKKVEPLKEDILLTAPEIVVQPEKTIVPKKKELGKKREKPVKKEELLKDETPTPAPLEVIETLVQKKKTIVPKRKVKKNFRKRRGVVLAKLNKTLPRKEEPKEESETPPLEEKTKTAE